MIDRVTLEQSVRLMVSVGAAEERNFLSFRSTCRLHILLSQHLPERGPVCQPYRWLAVESSNLLRAHTRQPGVTSVQTTSRNTQLRIAGQGGEPPPHSCI